jgi:aspartyl-tRNA(Asn)/glutamyl-tRNA(Gln) amidotransferase subunit B
MPETTLPYRIIVGLEIHVELETQTKMFCRCLNNPFHAPAATMYVCPVCMGLPGALPVPNKEAVRKTVLVGLALGSTMPKLAKWDRKHYFYPDNPKGYQISQYDLPFCLGGKVELLDAKGDVESTIRFERAHLEEDAGKLQHGGRPGYSNVDFNRAGVPLLEMVTMPDLTSPSQARRFLQELQLLVRTLGVSHADMEKGQLRCDVNINIAFDHEGTEIRTPITEIKNVNSSRAVERSIAAESQRHYDEWMANGPIRTRKNKITAGWDEDTESVNVQRAKEGANDYRYMPEPDLPPVDVYSDPELNPDELKDVLPVLPNVRRRALLKDGVNVQDIETLFNDIERVYQLDRVVAHGAQVSTKILVNWLINTEEAARLQPQALIDLIGCVEKGSASFSALKPRLSEIAAFIDKEPSESIENILRTAGLLHEHDEGMVESAIASVLAAHGDVAAQYKAGNERVFGFLVGQVMKELAGKGQPQKVSEALKHTLAEA